MALLAAGVITWSFWQHPTPAPVKRFTLSVTSNYDPVAEGGARMVISPNGQDFVYLGVVRGEQRIYHRRLDQTETRALAGTQGASRLFFSPDGKWVGFHADDQLKKVPLAGGSPQVICDVTDVEVLGATWGPDDDIIFGSRGPCSWSPDGKVLAYIQRATSGSDIWLLPLGGKPESFLATPAREIQPAFSPNGQWLAFTSDRSGRDEVYIAPYPGGQLMEQISPAGGSEPMWARESGELFYRSGDKMMLVAIETKPSLQVGAPRFLFEGSYARPPVSSANYDVTADGQRFVMVQEKRVPNQLQVVVNWFEELKRLVPTGE